MLGFILNNNFVGVGKITMTVFISLLAGRSLIYFIEVGE